MWATVVNGIKFVAGLENSQMRAVDMKGFTLQFPQNPQRGRVGGNQVRFLLS